MAQRADPDSFDPLRLRITVEKDAGHCLQARRAIDALLARLPEARAAERAELEALRRAVQQELEAVSAAGEG